MSKETIEKKHSNTTVQTTKGSHSLEKDSRFEGFDLDHDGIVSDDEIQSSKELIQLEKLQTQKKMSWIALSSMIILTIILLTDLVSNEKLDVLEELISMYYLAMAGVVCGYFGVSAWMSKK